MVKKQLQPRTEDRTVHLHKLVFKRQFKKRAGRAINEIKGIAAKTMGTKDVRIDQKLNKHIWHKGMIFGFLGRNLDIPNTPVNVL